MSDERPTVGDLLAADALVGVAVTSDECGPGEVVAYDGQRVTVEHGDDTQWYTPTAAASRLSIDWHYYDAYPEHATEAIRQHLDGGEEPAEQDANPGGHADETPALDALEPGDAFHNPDGTTLVVVGVEEDTPDDHGPLYQVQRVADDGTASNVTLLRPYHFESALAGGAEYDGHRYLSGPRAPFFCEACGHPRRHSERHAPAPDDMAVCSYGCKVEAERERRQDRRAARDTEGGE